ncbi:MAG: hypothetical protein JWP36_2298 [Paucimonas sp.]|nr:hypothetical protein [Paucimonas sp.]
MPNMTLGEIYEKTKLGMSSVEADLSVTLAALPSGSAMSVTDMIQLQYKMSIFTITAQTMSAIMKDLSDTMKSIVQKIG